MTSISSSPYSGQYYQLPTSNTSSVATTPTPTIPALASPTASNSLGAYLLDLSPDAQSYLSNYSSSDSSTGSSGGTGSFVLSNAQQKQISDILAKYKDAPQTQDTFNKIQDDLKAAGLSPQQLAETDKVKSFNPTQILINALNGNYGTPGASTTTSDADEQTKSNNYVQSIIKQWQSISSVAPAASVTA